MYTNTIRNTMGWSTAVITSAFTIMMALAGFSAAFFGNFVERNGPRKLAIYEAVLFEAGQPGAGMAVTVDSPVLFLLTALMTIAFILSLLIMEKEYKQ
ncbi:hypothetical protein [Alteribacillus bidgolensis]|uniref:hypothetical protein n=1 Tax=Alteribacillus bidgolensis TaxID=930129 RepID=UPI000BB6BA4F|nr:hypothetical protein [Alteribacillus bidgolensis]